MKYDQIISDRRRLPGPAPVPRPIKINPPDARLVKREIAFGTPRSVGTTISKGVCIKPKSERGLRFVLRFVTFGVLR